MAPPKDIPNLSTTILQLQNLDDEEQVRQLRSSIVAFIDNVVGLQKASIKKAC